MSTLPWAQPERVAILEQQLQQRIMILDGAMGTMIQRFELNEEDYRGQRFAPGYDTQATDNPGKTQDQRGNNDLLSLTQPHLIQSIHEQYLQAGADFIETNTFNSTSVAMADYHLEHLAYELNVAGASIARKACDIVEAATPGRSCFVVGILGPTNRTASLSPDVNRPGFRAITFDQLREAYTDAVRGLLNGGADIVMIETIFDTLNAKAAVFAIEDEFERRGKRWPVMISGTITDASGRTLSGQTAEAFWYSLRHAKPMAIGLNCALGAKDLRAYIDVLSRVADAYISVHPNAGLPNAFGGYDETAEDMAHILNDFANDGLINIVGGCCGTTPEHIKAIAVAVHSITPRAYAGTDHATQSAA